MFPKRATRKWTLSFQFCNQNSLQSFISYRITSGLITIIIWKFERGSRQYCSYCRLNGTKLLFQYYADQKLWHTSTGSDSQIHISWNTPTSNSAGKNQIHLDKFQENEHQYIHPKANITYARNVALSETGENISHHTANKVILSGW